MEKVETQGGNRRKWESERRKERLSKIVEHALLEEIIQNEVRIGGSPPIKGTLVVPTMCKSLENISFTS